MDEPPVTSERPVRLADALDELVTRVVRADGGDADRAEVWLLIARYALARAGEVTVTEIHAMEEE